MSDDLNIDPAPPPAGRRPPWRLPRIPRRPQLRLVAQLAPRRRPPSRARAKSHHGTLDGASAKQRSGGRRAVPPERALAGHVRPAKRDAPRGPGTGTARRS